MTLYADDNSLKRNNMTELFEDNQRDLERAVENLSFLLEQPIDVNVLDKLRQDITNESVSGPYTATAVYALTDFARRTFRNDTISCWTIHYGDI